MKTIDEMRELLVNTCDEMTKFAEEYDDEFGRLTATYELIEDAILEFDKHFNSSDDEDD